ncbi:hypothetical protein [Glutamicibacter sp.]|nr:hypothetical protein [Glutamicibacter sp.]HJX78093.1 hypothetical protein [Glutamicibacter sp.]
MKDAPLVGPILLRMDQIEEAHAHALHSADELGVQLEHHPLAVGLIIQKGELSKALEICRHPLPGISIVGMELKTSPTEWRNAVEEFVAIETTASRYIELDIQQIREGALEVLKGSAVKLKYRTGGLEAQLFPTPLELAYVISNAVQCQLPFKLTAGLHQATRHTNPVTGFTHHGFLNIALATEAAHRHALVHEMAEILEIEDHVEIAHRISKIPSTAWRADFESFGTCSIGEPIQSLIDMGLTSDWMHSGNRTSRKQP